MPNHVQNILRVTSGEDDFKRLLALMESDESKLDESMFDFSCVIPEPRSIRQYRQFHNGYDMRMCDCAREAMVLLGVKPNRQPFIGRFPSIPKEKVSEEQFQQFLCSCACLYETGEENPLDWNVHNWGTKWNAYEVEIDRKNMTIRFQTAWSEPEPVFEAIHATLPSMEFSVEYANEDIGTGCGVYYFGEGFKKECTEQDMDDPCEFACNVWGQSYEQFKKERKEYENDTVADMEDEEPEENKYWFSSRRC